MASREGASDGFDRYLKQPRRVRAASLREGYCGEPQCPILNDRALTVHSGELKTGRGGDTGDPAGIHCQGQCKPLSPAAPADALLQRRTASPLFFVTTLSREHYTHTHTHNTSTHETHLRLGSLKTHTHTHTRRAVRRRSLAVVLAGA